MALVNVIYRCFRHLSRIGRYRLSTNPSNLLAKERCHPSNCWTHLLLLGFFFKCAKCDGRINNASSKETANITMTTAGKGCQNLPVSPGIKSKGTKAIIVVVILKMTGRDTSLVPAMAAFIGLRPFFRYS